MRNPFLHARFFAGKLIHGLLQQLELCIWEGKYIYRFCRIREIVA